MADFQWYSNLEFHSPGCGNFLSQLLLPRDRFNSLRWVRWYANCSLVRIYDAHRQHNRNCHEFVRFREETVLRDDALRLLHFWNCRAYLHANSLLWEHGCWMLIELSITLLLVDGINPHFLLSSSVDCLLLLQKVLLRPCSWWWRGWWEGQMTSSNSDYWYFIFWLN